MQVKIKAEGLTEQAEGQSGLAFLVGELERVAVRLWLAVEPKVAAGFAAADMCDLMGKLGVAVNRARGDAEVAYGAALEAYWADKARRFAEAAPQGEGAVHTVDEYMAVCHAAVKLEAQRGKFLQVLDAFALEFLRLALDFCQPRACDCEIVFECRDLTAAEKRANALREIAGVIDHCRKVEDCGKAHEQIIAYLEGAGNTADGIDARTLSSVQEPGCMLDLAYMHDATETLREILDFDELAHEAEARRQGQRGPQEILLPTSALPRFLKEDATPREARILTGALSLLGEWCVVIPASAGCDGQSDRPSIVFRFETRLFP